MTKDRQLPKSQKSHRPGHERFKDLYAKEHAATTPELANRAPRQVAQSVTPNTSDGTTTTTANSTGRTGGECTPVTTKTPVKKKPKPKRSKKATKWSHVPSASDGDATHFENFENDGAAQMAVATMKTRKLQWSRETIDTDDAVDETDAGESFRDDIGGSAGAGYTKDSGSAGEPALPDLERTQEDDKWRDVVKRELTVDEPDAKNEKKLLSPTPSPPKKEAGGGSKEALKEATTKEAGKTVKEAKTQVPTARSPQKPAKEKSPTKPKEPPKTTAPPPPKQQENTKREQKPKQPPEKSKVEKRKATTPKKEAVTTRENKKPVPAAAPAAAPPAPAKAPPAPAPVPPTQTPAPVPVPVIAVAVPAQKRPPSESTAETKSTVETKREAKHPQTGVTRSKELSSANYRLAVKLMKILKRNNYLENALRFEEGERVRKHFEANGFAAQPPAPILALLNQALNFALETVLFRADDLDTQITNDLRVFIIKKNEARLAMLEVCFNRPDLMPNKWGGARKDVKRSKSSTKTREGKRGWFASLFGRGEK